MTANEGTEVYAVKKYPDVIDILKMKARHRHSSAALPFEKKIEIVFKLIERREFIKLGRAVEGSQDIKRNNNDSSFSTALKEDD